MTPSPDLERIRQVVDAELAMVESSRPRSTPTDVDAQTFDPTAADEYEVRLRSLRDSVVAIEELEEDPGTACKVRPPVVSPPGSGTSVGTPGGPQA